MTEKKPTLEYGKAPQRRHPVAYKVVTAALIIYATVFAMVIAFAILTAL